MPCGGAVREASGNLGHLKLSLGARYVDEAGEGAVRLPPDRAEKAAAVSRNEKNAASTRRRPRPCSRPTEACSATAKNAKSATRNWKAASGSSRDHYRRRRRKPRGSVEEMTPEAAVRPGDPSNPRSRCSGREQPASVMSLVPTSATEGTIYLSGEYGFFGTAPAPPCSHYSHPSGGEPSIAEVGWIAGAKENPSQGTEPCNIHRTHRRSRRCSAG